MRTLMQFFYSEISSFQRLTISTEYLLLGETSFQQRNKRSKQIGKYNFLSNFYKSEVEFEGVKYPTVEHAFQAAKTSDLDEREKILSNNNPAIAKKFGQVVCLRSDWEEVKYDIMYGFVRQKFEHEYLKKRLLDTGKSELVEETTWHDKYWGKCICPDCKGVGKNNLGLILQKVRDELLVKQGR